MPVHIDDAGFVRAPVALVYRRLTDVGQWPAWWHGTRVRALERSRVGERWALELRGRPLRRVRLLAHVHGWRHDAGFLLGLSGDLDGRAEFWLEPGHGGTIVHHIVAAEAAVPGGERWLVSDYRRALRRGLWGLKDALHLEARTSAGLLP